MEIIISPAFTLHKHQSERYPNPKRQMKALFTTRAHKKTKWKMLNLSVKSVFIKLAANLQEPELQTCCQRAPDGESHNSTARFHSSETTEQPTASVATQLLHPLSDRSLFLFPPTGVLGNMREGVLCPSPRLILSSPTSILKKIPKRAHLIHRQRDKGRGSSSESLQSHF